jgi:UDPglucose--hexose-1-phosphate uridylyltransferase
MPDQEKIQKPTCNVVVFENRFPSLSPNPSEPATRSTELYPVRPARGKCELVVYTPPHNSTLANEPGGHISDFEF